MNTEEERGLAAPSRLSGNLQIPALQDLQEALLGFSESIRARHAEMMRQFAPMLEQMQRVERRANQLEAAGWLPHYTSPRIVLDEAVDCDPELIDADLRRHYREKWSEVRKEIEQRLDLYDIDEAAKQTFREALIAHESGLYRMVARTLFPEVERVVRVELHGGKLDRITSQLKLREMVLHLSLQDVEPRGLLSMTLFNRLLDHVYADASHDAAVEKLTNDPVPNRHASLHGLVAYADDRSSLNSIFMSEFILQVVTALKRDALEEEQSA